MAPISLTLTFDTAEQAHHVLEAYKEARGFTTRVASERAAGILPPASAPISQHQQAIASLPAAPVAQSAGPAVADALVNHENPADHLDSRGVPHHPDYHGENKTEQGAWKRKRGHNKAAADAYEAIYLAPVRPVGNAPATAVSVAHTVPTTTANAGASEIVDLPPAPTAPVLPATPVAQVYEAPTVRYLPSIQEYDAKWIELCKAGKVTGNHQKMIETNFGAHPCSPQVRDVEENRRQIWVAFLAWEAGDSAASV